MSACVSLPTSVYAALGGDRAPACAALPHRNAPNACAAQSRGAETTVVAAPPPPRSLRRRCSAATADGGGCRRRPSTRSRRSAPPKCTQRLRGPVEGGGDDRGGSAAPATQPAPPVQRGYSRRWRLQAATEHALAPLCPTKVHATLARPSRGGRRRPWWQHRPRHAACAAGAARPQQTVTAAGGDRAPICAALPHCFHTYHNEVRKT